MSILPQIASIYSCECVVLEGVDLFPFWQDMFPRTGTKPDINQKVSNLYIAQIKQKHGIIERENYNKPKSEKGGQPECPKEIAIEEALKYFQMIPSES